MQFSFEDFTLDSERRELRGSNGVVAIEPQVFDLLVYLIENRDRVVSKDDLIGSVWGSRIVSNSTLDSRINAARKALGDSGKEQRLIKTIARKGVRFLVEVAASNSKEALKPEPGIPQQEVRFCTASDGVRIAYATAGQGPPLVKGANWLNHLDYDWQSPIWRNLFRKLAGRHRLIRYDERGNGLSDRDVADISFDAFVHDLESVVEASCPNRFALLGMSQGGAVSIVYALRHPERVSHLVLIGGFARGRANRDREAFETQLSLVRQGWGRENPAFRQFFTSTFVPDGTPEQMQWLNDLQRMTTSPENAVRIMQAIATIDVTDILARIAVPTLVLHSRDDAWIPFDEGRALAAGIPGARFVALESRNHLPLEGEPAWQKMIDETEAFLAS